MVARWNQLDRWRASELQIVHSETYDLATNWKLVFQNFNECYHCRSVHPGLEELSPVGQVYSYTTVRDRGGPFILALIDLASGHRVTGRIVDVGRELRIGMRVERAAPAAADWRSEGLSFSPLANDSPLNTLVNQNYWQLRDASAGHFA